MLNYFSFWTLYIYFAFFQFPKLSYSITHFVGMSIRQSACLYIRNSIKEIRLTKYLFKIVLLYFNTYGCCYPCLCSSFPIKYGSGKSNYKLIIWLKGYFIKSILISGGTKTEIYRYKKINEGLLYTILLNYD